MYPHGWTIIVRLRFTVRVGKVNYPSICHDAFVDKPLISELFERVKDILNTFADPLLH